MKPTSDEVLMREVANGDLDRLKILFNRHHKHVFNFLHQMSGDRALSEDLTQEVFYKIIKYRTSYKNGRFVSWMFTIARNSMSTHFRNKKEFETDLSDMTFKLADEDSKEDLSQLHIALRKLDPSDREVLVLNRLQEIKYPELAEITGSTPGAVKTKVSRALKKLRTVYFENDVL